eukprot:gene34219-44206_t
MREIFKTYYFPSFLCLKKSFERYQQNNNNNGDFDCRSPFYIGMSAPQGCGKTTFSDVIRRMFLYTNLECLSMSLDDFYLTGSEQDNLTQDNRDNFLLQSGTHDLPLLMDTLESLKR